MLLVTLSALSAVGGAPPEVSADGKSLRLTVDPDSDVTIEYRGGTSISIKELFSQASPTATTATTATAGRCFGKMHGCLVGGNLHFLVAFFVCICSLSSHFTST